MQAMLTKQLKKGVKEIHGRIIQDGIGRITLVVIDQQGNRSIKSFNKADYTIHYIND